MTSLFQFFLIITSAIIFNQSATAGDTRGNGGDAVICSRSSQNGYEGIYALDYFLGSLNTEQGPNTLVPVDSVAASLQRIVALLNAKLPKMGASLQQFVENITNHSDYAKPAIWLSVGKLEDVADEDLIYGTIANCLKKDSNKLNLKQAVVRFYDPDTKFTRYYFDRDILESFRSKGALQLSFLYVHEWLWSMMRADQVNNLRIINWILHSQSADSLSQDGLANSFRNLGIDSKYLTNGDRPTAEDKVVVKERFLCFNSGSSLRCSGPSVPPGASSVNFPGQSISALAAGDQHICALLKHKVKCWGDRWAYDGIEQYDDIQQLAANGASTCILRSQGEINCFGAIKSFVATPLFVANDSQLVISNFSVCQGDRAAVTCFFSNGQKVVYSAPTGEEISAFSTNTLATCIGYTSGTACYEAGKNDRPIMALNWKAPKQLVSATTSSGGGLHICGVFGDTASLNCTSTDTSSLLLGLPVIEQTGDVSLSTTRVCYFPGKNLDSARRAPICTPAFR